MSREKHKRRKPRGESTEAKHWDDRFVGARKARNGAGAKGSGQVVVRVETTGDRRMPMRTTDKPFKIDKRLVYEAYKAVKSNAGAAGVDGKTIEQFEADLRNNLYKLWNRMSSGSYFPPPVRAVSIPAGVDRILWAIRAFGAQTHTSICQSDTSSVGDAEVQTLCRKDDPCGSLSRTNGPGQSGFVCALAAWSDRRVCLMGAE